MPRHTHHRAECASYELPHGREGNVRTKRPKPRRHPKRTRRSSSSSPPWLVFGIAAVIFLTGVGLFAARRRRRPDSTETADGKVAWIVNRIHWPALLAQVPALTLTGPGAPAALRAAAQAVIESGGTVSADRPTADGPLTGLRARTARGPEEALADAHAATVAPPPTAPMPYSKVASPNSTWPPSLP